MGNCKDCKWWNAERYAPAGWRVCELTRVEEDKYVHGDSLAIVSVDYAGELMTKPEFGCVQFEGQQEA